MSFQYNKTHYEETNGQRKMHTKIKLIKATMESFVGTYKFKSYFGKREVCFLSQTTNGNSNRPPFLLSIDDRLRLRAVHLD